MIIESESDMFQKETDGKKRKVETLEGGQKQGNFQCRFNKMPEFQPARNLGFGRAPARNEG